MPKESRRMKINTRTAIKDKLREVIKDKEVFTSKEITEQLIEIGGTVRLSPQRIAQHLKGNGTHEFHKGLKKWIKTRL